MIYLFDLIGTFAFAVYGAYLAERKGFDLFGISVTALVSGLGGGTIRELLLNRLPVYFTDFWYLLAVLFGIIIAIVTYKNFHKLQNLMLMIDALGLVTFALIGAERAAQFRLGLLAIILFATLSAVGGGIIRDLMLGRIPEIFYQDFYATPAIILGFCFYFLENFINQPAILISLLVTVYLIRVLSIYYKIQLWKPQKESSV